MKCDYCDREAVFTFANPDYRENLSEVHKRMRKEERKQLKSEHSP